MNISESHENTLAAYENIIKNIELLPAKSDRQFKIKVTFIDNTSLRVSETFSESKLIRYSYYYLDIKNELIIGWDSAPHHKHLKNFPYHKHVGEYRKIESSTKMNLEKVLHYMKNEIEKNG